MAELANQKDAAKAESVTVEKVIDGDSVVVLTEAGEKVEVRLWGIDAPELDQECGRQATMVLENRIIGSKSRKLRMEKYGQDLFGRPLVLLYDEHMYGPEKSVNRSMVEKGYAYMWHDRSEQYRNHLIQLGFDEAEREAKENGRGVWSQPEHERIYPVIFRRWQKREKEQEQSIQKLRQELKRSHSEHEEQKEQWEQEKRQARNAFAQFKGKFRDLAVTALLLLLFISAYFILLDIKDVDLF